LVSASDLLAEARLELFLLAPLPQETPDALR
jgi:hypothetical protein